MFTGLVQTQGIVKQVVPDNNGGLSLEILENRMAPLLDLGESVSVNGVCLTVVEKNADSFHFQIGPETVAKTTFGSLKVDESVNLERALRVGDAIGGHFVSGHVDCVGQIVERSVNGEWNTVWFEFPSDFDDLLVNKGSIAVDGVSLTVVEIVPSRFSVMLIPHTLSHTTLGVKTVGDSVNLEFDLLAKHVRKLFRSLSFSR